ncbi:MAG: acetate/propionate family kinase [Myxococcales bacterium]
MRVLCINSGSSSLKYALFDDALARVASGAVERIGSEVPDHRRAIEMALDRVAGAGVPDAVAHRLVHGGPAMHRPQRVTAALLATMREIVHFAPIHLPPAIDCMEAVARRHPGVPQVACFDTSFHWDLPPVARRLPLPADLDDQGVRRYGFHGLSYEYVVSTLGPRLGRRAVVAHLGNGASLAALLDGKSIDTSMGLTPSGGIPMSTRSGDLDPGVVVFLLARGIAPSEIEPLVTRRSGLLGVSGLSGDMRTLLGAGTAGAALAVDQFCYAIRKQIGAYAAALEGLDTLVFTGGIGERAAPVRERVCAGLAHLGVALDPGLPDSETISSAGSRVAVLVVKTDEDLVMARHARKVLGA